jgi:hypothetical protein
MDDSMPRHLPSLFGVGERPGRARDERSTDRPPTLRMVRTHPYVCTPGRHAYVVEPRRKTIYVREADDGIWQRAVAYARARRLTMSALIMTALEEYLARHDKD